MTDATSRHYWALRTDPARREFAWAELRVGRIRQGWGYRDDLHLEHLAELRRRGAKLEQHQQDAWRGNRRLLRSEPDGMHVGDLVVLLNLPRPGAWSIVRVTGGYRFEISDTRNLYGERDYGHVRDVALLTDERGIDPASEAVSDALRRSMRNRQRMWRIDPHAEELERLARGS